MSDRSGVDPVVTIEHVSATTTVAAPAEAVFAVLADPSRHAAIDGTGWVTAAVDSEPITERGVHFRMRMYHRDHAEGTYETVNEIIAYEESRVLAWRTGYVDPGSGRLSFGGWWWRYDLTPLGPDRTSVTLTYDWSEVGPGLRAYLTFPLFADDHLDNSLRHLAQLVSERR